MAAHLAVPKAASSVAEMAALTAVCLAVHWAARTADLTVDRSGYCSAESRAAKRAERSAALKAVSWAVMRADRMVAQMADYLAAKSAEQTAVLLEHL
jgi:hypothetical protein